MIFRENCFNLNLHMTAQFKKIVAGTSIILSSLAFASPAFAAAPDGNGPWADSVSSFSQGLMKNGGAVPAVRSDPTAALGVAEGDTTEGHFVSLGFGGVLTLGFVNGISGGSLVVESTNAGYPIEKAKVELSADGSTWFNAGTLSQSGTVNQPQGLVCAKFARLTDVSNKDDFSDATADGYDVDGVKALGDPCTPPTPPCSGNCGCADITQVNSSTVITSVGSSANTGNNKGNKNTGGSVNITTGNASSSASVSVTGSTNTVTGNGCCNGGGNNVTISGNGAGSHNTVNINSGKKLPTLTLIRH